MIENRSEDSEDFLCVTYDRFDQPAGFKPSLASWSYHLNQICRLVVLGVLVKIEEDPGLIERLSEHQKQVLKFQLQRFVGPLSSEEFESATKALKSLGDKARDFWNRYGGPIALVIEALLAKIGLDRVEVPREMTEEAALDETLRFHFEQLLAIAQALGLKSTYILVDRVDELEGTSADATATLDFIRPLAHDLLTLEAPGVAFKFFLWNMIESGFRSGGGRPDRVPIFTLDWSLQELETMLSQRLKAYSGGRVSSMNQLLCEGSPLDLHKLVAYLANGSPRDMIRVSERIMAEQTRTSESEICVEEHATWTGIRVFANERAEELIGSKYLGELRRVGRPTFTINNLASDVFRVGYQAGRRKVQLWQETGAVAKVAEIPNPPNRPLHLFGVVDLRVLVAMLPSTDVGLIMGNFAIPCPSCGTVCISGETSLECPACQTNFALRDSESLLETCTLTAADDER